MPYFPNFIWTLGDVDTIQDMAAKGRSAGDIARVVTKRMSNREDPYRCKLSASDVVAFCDYNGIFVRTRDFAR